MRFLGIDFGTKRVGLAISDENGQIAFPKKVVPNDSKLISSILEVLESEKVSEIVVGESTNFNGVLNPVAKQIEEFILALQTETNLPIQKQKEFFTSVEARRYKDETKSTSNSVDAAAAALILQRYLDRRSLQEGKN